jgi:hypothetical protein
MWALTKRNKMSDQESADRQSTEFLYDLRNNANENGFKPEEKWQLSLVTLKDKAAIEKKYHATVAAKASPEMLSAMISLVQTGLNQPITNLLDIKTMGLNQLQYLIGYNPARERR